MPTLFPSPMPTFRSDNVRDVARPTDVVEPSAASRGVVSIAPTADYVQRMGRGEAQLQATYAQRGRAPVRAGEDGAPAAIARRAVSAPPRALLGRSSGMLNNGSSSVAALLQPNLSSAGSTDHFSASSRSTAATGNSTMDSSYAQKLDTAAKIARWAPGTLSNYYETRERLNIAGSAENGPGVQARRMKSSLRRHTPAPGAAATQSSSASIGSGGSKSVSVSSSAPFATGSNFV
jgi:hypothetical protein